MHAEYWSPPEALTRLPWGMRQVVMRESWVMVGV